MGAETDNNIRDFKRLSAYNNTLFAVGIACVIAGLFYPAVPGLVDVLLIFGFSLCAAVIAISFSSKKPSELPGFSVLAISAAAVLLTANIASAKLVLLKATASNIINFAAAINFSVKFIPVWLTAFLFSAISTGLLIAVGKLTKKIATGCADFLEVMLTLERAQAESDFAVIDSEQSDLLAQQKGFFFSAAAFGKFGICITVAICFVTLFSIVASIIPAAVKTSASTQNLTCLVSSCGVFILLMMFLSVAAVTRFVTKSCLALIEQTRLTEEQFQERIKVAAREVATSQITDYENNNSKSFEQPVEFEPFGDFGQEDSMAFTAKELDNESSYQMIANMLAESFRNKVTLMAAENSTRLPVTIPVNTAIKLAQNGQKTLIIDFDLKRSAISKVFEIKDCQTKVVRTAIEYLYLLSAQKLAKVPEQNLRQIFTKLNSSFDRIIIYAPDVNELTDNESRAGCPCHIFEHVNSAMLFSAERQSFSNLRLVEQLKKEDCRILQRQDVLEAV